MKRRILICNMVIWMLCFGACVHNHPSGAIDNESKVESKSAYIIPSESYSDATNAVSSSQEEKFSNNIVWETEQELKEERIEYYGSETISEDFINEKLEDKNREHICYRKDNCISSCVAYNGFYESGITEVASTGEKLDFSQIWKEDVDYFELIKPYLINETLRSAQDEVFVLLVENYEEVINEMDANPGQWYWYMDTTGVGITFRNKVMRSAKMSYVLPYTEWKAYLKEEYLPSMEQIVGRISTNQKFSFEDGSYIQIVDVPKLSKEAIIKTDSSELAFGKEYGDCVNAYILNGEGEGYYLLIESAGITEVDDGWTLSFYVLDGAITQCDAIECTQIADVEGFSSITIAHTLIENEQGSYHNESRLYGLDEDGKFYLY